MIDILYEILPLLLIFSRKAVFKKKCAWHTENLNLNPEASGRTGSLPNLFIIIYYQVVMNKQKDFWIGATKNKNAFSCHALTHGIDLSWSPQQ